MGYQNSIPRGTKLLAGTISVPLFSECRAYERGSECRLPSSNRWQCQMPTSKWQDRVSPWSIFKWSFRVIMDNFLESKFRLLYTDRMTFTQIMAIWTPGISLQDHLKGPLVKLVFVKWVSSVIMKIDCQVTPFFLQYSNTLCFPVLILQRLWEIA